MGKEDRWVRRTGECGVRPLKGKWRPVVSNTAELRVKGHHRCR